MAAFYTFEDLSGSTDPKTSDNPYIDLISACGDKADAIATRYDTHRTNRNAQQRAKMLAPEFTGVVTDDILADLENPNLPDAQDWRHCLVFWARPPTHIRALINQVQQRIRTVLPHFWLMPQDNLHMTALEVTHSRTAEEISLLVNQLSPAAPQIANWPQTHRARLVRPILSFDAQAFALSFLPATSGRNETNRTAADDEYTYHHLRRDLFDAVRAAGVNVDSRYVIPSAHLTIGRFIERTDTQNECGGVDEAKIKGLMSEIEAINEWLRDEYWPAENGEVKQGGEWIVGEEKGLDFRHGTLWYGGGETILLGQGF